jgi:hypothetical protein
VRVKAWVWVGADWPDAVTVTLYVPVVAGVFVKDAPQPLRSSRLHSKSLRRLFAAQPNRMTGHAMAITMPVGVGLIVITVLSGPLPESVAGANVQPHPVGRPVQAKLSDELKPFCGATETVREPDLSCVMLRVLLDRDRV